jgi:hypothetical protein
MKNYYEILGVAQTSDAETITAAFKALMQKLDSGTDSATAAKGNTKEFNDVYAVLKAHEVLIDPDARREYDASLAKAKPQDVPPPTPKIPVAVEEEEVFVYPSANAFTEQQPSRWNTKIWLLPVLLLGFFLIYQIIQGQNSADPNAIVTVTVTGTANVRDAPTSSGSTVLGEYPPGTTLRGRWVPGNLDPSERWLELQEGGRFVWGRNLREVEASPEISQNDITKYFGTEKEFCDYLNLDILSPGVKKEPITNKWSEKFWERSISKFNASLYGLDVVGTAEFRQEGSGARAIIFDNSNTEVFNKLGNIYAGKFPTSISGEGAMYCPECEYTFDHARFTTLLDEETTVIFFGIGKSSIACGFYD